MMILFLLFLKLLASGDAFSEPSRRDFVQRAAMAAASSAWFSQSLPVQALYERDVGGSERSAETAAYNLQVHYGPLLFFPNQDNVLLDVGIH